MELRMSRTEGPAVALWAMAGMGGRILRTRRRPRRAGATARQVVDWNNKNGYGGNLTGHKKGHCRFQIAECRIQTATKKALRGWHKIRGSVPCFP